MRRAQREEQQGKREGEEREKLIQIDDHAQRKQTKARSVFSARVCVCAIAAISTEWQESDWERVSERNAVENVKNDDDACASQGFQAECVYYAEENGE